MYVYEMRIVFVRNCGLPFVRLMLNSFIISARSVGQLTPLSADQPDASSAKYVTNKLPSSCPSVRPSASNEWGGSDGHAAARLQAVYVRSNPLVFSGCVPGRMDGWNLNAD